MRSIFVLLILVMIGLNGKGQSVTALPDSVLSQCCLEVTLLNGNVTTVDWVFVQYITRDGTGTKLFVEYAPNFGGIQWETQIRIQDDFDDVLERSKFIVIPFTVGTTDYGINRNWIANIEENTTTGGTWIYGRFGTPTKRKFSAVEDYETMKNLLLACRPRAIVVAENGLYTEGDTVRMGGFLIENTSITTEGYNWQMKDTLSSAEFGLDYLTPETGDTTVYWGRRSGSVRQMVQMGNRYWYNTMKDTVGGLYSDLIHTWNAGDPFLKYLIFNPLAPNSGTAWMQIQRDNSFLLVSNETTNPFYTLGWTATSTVAQLGANESGSGDPGNGVVMGAYGFGTTEYLFMRTKAVDDGTASVGQYLKLLNTSTGEVDFATIDLSAYLPIADTAAMLTNYPNTAGYGIIDGGKTWKADTTSPSGLATRLFAKTLPTSIANTRIAVSNGSNLVGYSNLVWNSGMTITNTSNHLLSVLSSDANNRTRVDNTGFYIARTSDGALVQGMYRRVGATRGELFITARDHISIANDTRAIMGITGNGVRIERASAFDTNLSTTNPNTIFEVRSTIKSSSPFPLHTLAESDAITGVQGNFDYETTQNGLRWHNGTRKAYALESTFARGTATRVPFFDANGQVTQSINHAYNVSNGAFSVGTPILANVGASFLSDLPITAAFYGTVNNGVRSNVTISTSGWGRPGATTLSVNGSNINGYDGFLHFINNGFAGGSVSGNGFWTSKSYILGYTPGPANTSNLFINSTNINEYTQGANYPSGSNYYNIEASLQSVIAANNTGQTAVRAGLQVSGRYLNFKNDQGVVIGSTNATTSVPNSSAALDINYSNRGLLPPRGSATSNITRGIGSLTIVSGGSGYGTGTGVVITISGGGGNGAAISLIYTAGVVTGATIILKGTLYTSAPTISISGGTGTGAVITCALEPYPDGLIYYNTTTKTYQHYQTTNNRWQDIGSYQSDNLHVVDSTRLQNTPTLASIAGLLTRDANGWVGIGTIGTGLSYSGGVLSATGSADGNGIYSSSATLSNHTTRARVPDDGNLFFSQTYNGGADSSFFYFANATSGERYVGLGMTDTASTGGASLLIGNDGAGEMSFELQTIDAVNGNTQIRGVGGDLLLSSSAGNISLSAQTTNEVQVSGLVRAKQEAYYEITSTSSPQTFSSDYSDNFVNQGGTQASFTFLFPASPEDGQILMITWNNAISVVTLDGNGNTITGTAVTTATAGTRRMFKFYGASSTWVKIF